MSRKIKVVLLIVIALAANIYSQLDTYRHQIPINGVSDKWHLLTLPENSYQHMRSDLGDIRVFATTVSGDTIEAPYILYRRDTEVKQVYIGHKQINTTHNSNGYYYTLLVDDPGILSEILLDFDKDNYDLLLQVEGSNDQAEWFTIVDDYRVLSINTETTNYAYNRVIFPMTQYKYYRLLVKTDTDPKLKSAKTIQVIKKEGQYDQYPIVRQDVSVDKGKKQTTIELTFEQAVPVSELELSVANDFDYYRPIKIQYLADSVKTDRGYSYQYRTLQRGTLSSIAANTYNLKSTICRKVKVIVSDGDNQSLKFNDSKIKGSVYEMAIRFTEPTDYYLAYGNTEASRPSYDIQEFAKTIPADISKVSVGDSQLVVMKDKPAKEPLVKNQLWLWLVMGLVILLLGWFSLKMISKK